MRIGINGWFLRFPNTGIGQYMRNLLKFIDILDNDNEYFLFVDEKEKNIELGSKFEKIYVNHPIKFLHKDIRKTLWEQYLLPNEFKNKKLDFIHIPYFAPLYKKTIPEVMTIHDASPLRFTWKNMGKSGVYDKLYRELFFSFLKKAEIIIVVSHFLKKELLELTNISENKIKPIQIDAGNEYRIIDDKDEINRRILKYNITKKYIFCVGDTSYRKNLETLIVVYMSLDEDIKEEYDLVICGNAKYSKRFQKMALKEPKNRINLIGYASSDGDLPYLYNGAYLFVFPSRYEGFGIPPLEAMKCGVPVISNNSSAIKEVVDDGGILVDTTKAENIKNKIIGVLNDKNLHSDLKRKGIEQSKKFSWEKAAEKTLEVYKTLLIK